MPSVKLVTQGCLLWKRKRRDLFKQQMRRIWLRRLNYMFMHERTFGSVPPKVASLFP